MTEEKRLAELRKQQYKRARRFPCPSQCNRDGEPVGMDYVCSLGGDREFSGVLYQCPVCKTIKEF
jgi:hypothetical protein